MPKGKGITEMVAGTNIGSTISLHKLLISDQSLSPFRHNIYSDKSEQDIEAFITKYDLWFPQFKHINTMNAYMYPDASFERATLCGKLMALLYYIDDEYADTAESKGIMGSSVPPEYLAKIERSAVAFETGWLPPHSGGLERAFQELRLEIQDTVEPEWMIRFSQDVRQHITYALNLQAYGWETDGNVPYERYAGLTEIVSGMYLTIDLIEYVNDFSLLPHVVYYPTIRRLQQACARIAAFANDLFSYEKEVINDGLSFNLVAVLERIHNTDFATAANMTIDIINHETRDFFKLVNEVAIWDDTTNALVRQYVDGMAYLVGATWHWQIRSARYRSQDSPFTELLTA